VRRGRPTSAPPPVSPVPMRWPNLSAEASASMPAGAAGLGATGGWSAGAAELERARQQGRAEGLAETAALRQQLVELHAQLAAQQQDVRRQLGSAAVDAALVIIEAWLEGDEADRRARLLPVVERWANALGVGGPLVAWVAAADEVALRDVVAGLGIEVRVDPELLPGDLRLRGERAMTELRWDERLSELREALLAMYAEAESPAESSGVPESLNEAQGSRP
jgi:flagellar biosynthesis/type III secretory pathway protein FliH